MAKQAVPDVVSISFPKDLKNLSEAELRSRLESVKMIPAPQEPVKKAITFGLGEEKVNIINSLLRDKKNLEFKTAFKANLARLKGITDLNDQIAEAISFRVSLAETIRSVNLTDVQDNRQTVYRP